MLSVGVRVLDARTRASKEGRTTTSMTKYIQQQYQKQFLASCLAQSVDTSRRTARTVCSIRYTVANAQSRAEPDLEVAFR